MSGKQILNKTKIERKVGFKIKKISTQIISTLGWILSPKNLADPKVMINQKEEYLNAKDW